MAPLRGKRRTGSRTAADFVVDRGMRGQRRIRAADGAEFVVDRAEHRTAQLAGRQDGIAARAQLRALGLSGDAIDRRIASGAFVVLLRGVYAIGHGAVTPRGWARAALLAIGPDAALSHRTAAFLWRLADPPHVVEVSVPGRRLRPREHLWPHCVAPFRDGEVRRCDGLRVTSPLRTLQDLRRAEDIERLAAEAQVLHLVTSADVAHLVADPAPTRNRFEHSFRSLLRRAGLPQPLVNHRVAGHECDFVWLRERVIVETDGWGSHGNREAFEDDRDRDAHLAALGWVVVRVTWRALTTEPILVAARLARTLAARDAAVPG
jgi:very-short-patch-repair endonuclease